MENIHGDSLPDNYKEYAFSVQHPLQADVKPKSFVLAPHIYATPLVVDSFVLALCTTFGS